ncbi:hypothetical protein HOI18_01325 [Candidatus Uhrbacteria bacterium]|jgi:hypothetical protein|nr:hypothetical protein [Candidatus Uhrbacteria bacterium]
MWRIQSTHEQSETEYLDQAIERIEGDQELFLRAEALLSAAEKAEPLMAECFRTPQDIRYHSEGPTVRYHLRLMLMVLYALSEEKLHLIDIEEFRRLQGYEGEIDELEEILKENIALFEVFILCHDVGKWPSVFFSSKKSSRGDELGFQMGREHHFAEKHDERVQMREKYIALFAKFKAQHPNEPASEVQSNFFLTYGIEVHYPGHARMVHSPVYEDLIDRFVMTHKLPGRDRDLVFDLMSYHIEFLHDFKDVNSHKIGTYLHLATKRGYDGDDFVDLMQGCLLLDTVFGSKRLSAHGHWHDPSILVNCLRSEHEFAPLRRVEKEAEREAAEKRGRNQAFKEVGLDGIAMMDLLKMEAGPKFGMMLRRIHAAILGQGEMPKFDKKIAHEIEQRSLEYYNKIFVKGE